MTRVRKLPGVALVTPRSKISCTCLGRPISRFSRITSSKKILPLTGRSRTWVNDSSACRIEIWYRYPACRSRAGKGWGSWRSHFRRSASILSADNALQIACSRFGFGTGLNAVVQCLISNLLAVQLLLGVFVAVQAELGVIGKVGTELQEKQAEVVVDAVEIIMVHHSGGFD